MSTVTPYAETRSIDSTKTSLPYLNQIVGARPIFFGHEQVRQPIEVGYQTDLGFGTWEDAKCQPSHGVMVAFST
jgi:hypothetical protein